MIDFKFKKIKYSLKLLDMCNFIKGSLSKLSKFLNNKDKFITKEHFKDNFELLNYTTDKVKNNSILKKFPALISKTSIKYNDLSEFQRKNLKENYKLSEKLITHLGYDKNCYISFEMYEMMISLGYKINVKKILEYKHSNFMKPYIDFLFEKKSYYKKIGDTGMSNTFKILANSLFGVMMTRCERFKDFKIVT